jgi:hypothetical protein
MRPVSIFSFDCQPSVHRCLQNPDTPKVYMDAPIAVQIVARTLEEEAVIAMSEIIDDALKAQILARL